MNLVYNLSEGLTPDALINLVSPIISIDEYESKISDMYAIVVGISVNDLDPANDLAGFIDLSSTNVLDTDVSPAPLPTGEYVVFIEIERNKNFPAKLMKLLKEINNISGKLTWKFNYGSKKELPVNKENITKHINLDSSTIEEIPNDKELTEHQNFWKYAEVDRIEIHESNIVFKTGNTEWNYKMSKKYPTGAINLLETEDVNTLQKIIGSSYNVWKMNNKIVVQCGEDFRVLEK
jgi:hypothetical protein